MQGSGEGAKIRRRSRGAGIRRRSLGTGGRTQLVSRGAVVAPPVVTSNAPPAVTSSNVIDGQVEHAEERLAGMCWEALPVPAPAPAAGPGGGGREGQEEDPRRGCRLRSDRGKGCAVSPGNDSYYRRRRG